MNKIITIYKFAIVNINKSITTVSNKSVYTVKLK